jgi:hypothetical protein
VIDASPAVAFSHTQLIRRLVQEQKELASARLGIDPDQRKPVPTVRIKAVKAGKFAVPSA